MHFILVFKQQLHNASKVFINVGRGLEGESLSGISKVSPRAGGADAKSC
jgi:hypothetical protein